MTEEIHKGDIDTKFLVTVQDNEAAIDISSASTKEIVFKKPDGTIDTHAATFENTGTDGQIYYKTVSGDLDAEGTWTLQAKIIMGDGTWHSSVKTFSVYETLE